MEPFRNIGILGREGSGVAETLQRLIAFLRSRALNIIVCDQIEQLVEPASLAGGAYLLAQNDR